MVDMLAQQVVNGLVMGAIYGLYGLGLSLIYTVVRMINFAQGESVMIGALATFLLTENLGVPYGLSAVAGIVIAIGSAIIVQHVTVQPLWKSPRVSALISTIGMSIFISHFAMVLVGPNPEMLRTAFAQEYLSFGPIRISAHRLMVALIAVVAVVGVHLFLRRTWTGLAMRALMEDGLASQLVGADPRHLATVTFALGGFLAGLSGVLLAPLLILTPQDLGIDATVRGFAVLVLGGLGNIWGVILAGPVIGLAESFSTAFLPSGFQTAVVFGFMIIALLLRPEGLFTSQSTFLTRGRAR